MEQQSIVGSSARVTSSSLNNKTGDFDALAFLTDNHNKTRSLFKAIDKLTGPEHASDKMDLVKKVCADLMIHMAVEESIFYPAIRAHSDDSDVMRDAAADHDGAKALIVRLGQLDSSDPLFDAHLKLLREAIAQHVKEEETAMFARVRKTDLDLHQLGDQLIDATIRMRAQHGLPVAFS